MFIINLFFFKILNYFILIRLKDIIDFFLNSFKFLKVFKISIYFLYFRIYEFSNFLIKKFKFIRIIII
jgi:hypothetical protein